MLVVVGVLGFVVFGGGGASVLGNGPDDTIPPFDWAQGKTTAVSVKSNEKSTPAVAKAAATDISTALDTLYTEAFLDPGNWRDGSYDEVWEVFADDAAGAAQKDASTLTVGAGGGDTYTRIADPKGRLSVRVLLNDENQVAAAVAVVRFSAVGSRTDGKETLFHSTGQYFLQRTGGGWHVYSFHVDRDDTVRTPSPAPSGGASAEAS